MTQPALCKSWRPLTRGMVVDVVAPSGRDCDPDTVERVKALLESWQLIPRVSPDLFGEHLLCANTDENRFKQLREALLNPESSAVWCLRGGYGCTRLMPALIKLKVPKISKLFIGFSDITTLHLFLQQKWHWQTLHGPSASQVAHQRIHADNIQELKKVVFGKLKQLVFSLSPLNDVANHTKRITSSLIGGNLTLVQASLATPWQIETKGKILFLEEVNETAYRVDRMLQHLQQAGILRQVQAIVFGDFISEKKSNDEALMQAVLKHFAKAQHVPILQCTGVGHGEANRSLPLATSAEIKFSKKQLTVKITN